MGLNGIILRGAVRTSGGSNSTPGNINIITTLTDKSKAKIEDNKPLIDPATGKVKSNIDFDTLMKAVEMITADSQGEKTVSIEIKKVDGAKSYAAELPTSLLSNKTDGLNKYEIVTDVGSLKIPGNMLGSSNISTSSVEISMGTVDKSSLTSQLQSAIGDRPVVDLNIKSNGKNVTWNNPDAPVTVTIPYTPSENELKNPEHIVVWYIDENGEAASVSNGRYDVSTGKVTFTVSHFSKYAVAYVNKTFSDMADYSWAKKQIEILASKGIIRGTSNNTFEPSANITRADFLLLLVKTLGLSAVVDSNFNDVKKSDYYYEAVGIAKKLGISDGAGNNLFNPNDEISRQDMMTLTAKALKFTKKLNTTGTVSDLISYIDTSNVATYAVNSIASMVMEGLVQGDNYRLNPLGHATRAETAVLMYRVYNK